MSNHRTTAANRPNRLGWWAAIVALVFASTALADVATSQPSPGHASPYAAWKNGPSSRPDYFPIAVWLQDPRNAEQYAQAGINLYVGLWKGPTEQQLAALKAAGMQVICDQNAVGLKHKDDPTIIGWMHGDEPDNAQAVPGGKGYGPPIEPKRIVEDYGKLVAADPARPVMLNLGQGVAWDGWYGRGVRTRHPEDYAEYVKGCDIASFDIYPVAHDHKDVAGKLWFVASGVERLRKWASSRPVWNCIECTRISSDHKATPQQVRAEVWMSLVHGSSGLIYFVHEWKPKFNEHALLNDPEMLKAVTAINAQIHKLAPVLNSHPVPDAVTVATTNPDVPVAVTARKHDGWLYLFAVCMRDGRTEAEFIINIPTMESVLIQSIAADGQAMELIETVKRGPTRFRDDFGPWAVHIYRVRLPASQ